MNSFKLSNYNLTKSQFCISPIFNVIAMRHLEEIKNQSTWQGKVVHLIIGMIEFIPFVGFLFSIGEAYVAQKRQSSLQSLSINHQAASSPPASKNASSSEWFEKALNQSELYGYRLILQQAIGDKDVTLIPISQE